MLLTASPRSTTPPPTPALYTPSPEYGSPVWSHILLLHRKQRPRLAMISISLSYFWAHTEQYWVSRAVLLSSMLESSIDLPLQHLFTCCKCWRCGRERRGALIFVFLNVGAVSSENKQTEWKVWKVKSQKYRLITKVVTKINSPNRKLSSYNITEFKGTCMQYYIVRSICDHVNDRSTGLIGLYYT